MKKKCLYALLTIFIFVFVSCSSLDIRDNNSNNTLTKPEKVSSLKSKTISKDKKSNGENRYVDENGKLNLELLKKWGEPSNNSINKDIGEDKKSNGENRYVDENGNLNLELLKKWGEPSNNSIINDDVNSNSLMKLYTLDDIYNRPEQYNEELIKKIVKFYIKGREIYFLFGDKPIPVNAENCFSLFIPSILINDILFHLDSYREYSTEITFKVMKENSSGYWFCEASDTSKLQNMVAKIKEEKLIEHQKQQWQHWQWQQQQQQQQQQRQQQYWHWQQQQQWQQQQRQQQEFMRQHQGIPNSKQ